MKKTFFVVILSPMNQYTTYVDAYSEEEAEYRALTQFRKIYPAIDFYRVSVFEH